MNQISERDKIIIDLKSELFDIQQNAKNIKRLEESNNDYQNVNQKLHEENNNLEFLLSKTREQTSKEINDLKLELANLNDELSQKKETNIKLFLENENLEQKVNLLIEENNNLSLKIKNLMNKEENNEILQKKYQQEIKIYQNDIKNTNLNIEKYQKIIKQLKEKFEKNIHFFHTKINELQLAINKLYCDNKKLVKIFRASYNNKEINENIISTLIKSNLLPKKILTKEFDYCEAELQNSILDKNNSNDDIAYISKKKKNLPLGIKTNLKEYFNSQKHKKIFNRNIGRNNESHITRKNKTTTLNRPICDNDIFTPYGYDLNKSYNFKNMKLNKNNSNKNIFVRNKIMNKENVDSNKSFVLSNSFNDKRNNQYFYELIETQEENIILKKQILNLAQQNEKIINEIDNIVKISGMSTIDVTTEGIKHLEQIIFNNRELLEKYLDEVRKSKIYSK